MTEKKNKDGFITWYPKATSLSEIYQANSLQFSFLSSPKDGNKQCHQWVLCRDFLHDASMSTISGKTSTIFGFTYNPKKDPKVDLEKMRMLVRHTQISTSKADDFADNVDRAILLLHHFEKIAELKPSKAVSITDTAEQIPVWLFIGARDWVRSPFLVSLYSLIIRLGTNNCFVLEKDKDVPKALKKLIADMRDGKANGNEIGYIREITYKRLVKIVKNYKDLFFEKNDIDPSYGDVSNIQHYHNYSGILSLCQGRAMRSKLQEKIKKL